MLLVIWSGCSPDGRSEARTILGGLLSLHATAVDQRSAERNGIMLSVFGSFVPYIPPMFLILMTAFFLRGSLIRNISLLMILSSFFVGTSCDIAWVAYPNKRSVNITFILEKNMIELYLIKPI